MARYGYTYATVNDYPDFDPAIDAEMLRKAMKGWGTDEQAIIDVLAQRSNWQRQEIYTVYKASYGRDLIDDLKSELSGKFEDAIIAVMMPSIEFLARHLHKAVSGIGTDEESIIEIMVTSTNTELEEIKDTYENLFGNSLESDLSADTSGHFRRLLVSLCQAMRDESPDVDGDEALADAQALFEAGEGQWGTEESVFNRILVTKNFYYLQFVFAEYEKLTGLTIEHSIKNETSGDLQMGLLAIVQCVRSIPAYFAERLYRAMKGFGTDDRTLIRIVAVRSERDMVLIKSEFEKNYGRTLEHFIAGDTSGDYKKFLLALVRG
uniref:Annexin n=1 Tax=Scolopendra viridis TaxID=118503 RepID=A0A4D5R961_SCOVI